MTEDALVLGWRDELTVLEQNVNPKGTFVEEWVDGSFSVSFALPPCWLAGSKFLI